MTTIINLMTTVRAHYSLRPTDISSVTVWEDTKCRAIFFNVSFFTLYCRDEFTVMFLHSSFCYAKSQLWRKLQKAWIACTCTCMCRSFLRVTVIFE